tara:strand:- start:72 stop:1238 length:1167 start_codon:yes stop_codon:yes gene_type:complete
MNYIQQAYKGLHEGWRYLVGTIIIIIFVFAGQIPFTVAAIIEANNQGLNIFELDESTMMGVLESNFNLALMLLSFAVGLVGIFAVNKWLHKMTITQLTTARKKIDWKRFWVIFFAWGILSSGLVLVDYFMSPENYVWNFDLKNFLILSVIAIALVPLQTSCEEYLFRGYLMQGLGVSTNSTKFPFILFYVIFSFLSYFLLNEFFNLGILWSWGYYIFVSLIFLIILNVKSFNAIISVDRDNIFFKIINKKSTPLIITSVIFGMLHIANPEVEKLGYVIMIYYIGTGFFLGIITLMDEGMELALGFHAANNLFTALLVTADWTAFQTYSILKDTSDPTEAALVDIVVPVFVIFPILLFILSKMYGWTNWKDKLFGKVTEPPKEDYKIIE